jgi:nitrite reductase (NADH) large subunit
MVTTALQNVNTTASQPKIIVVGAGPVGIRFTQELLKHQPEAEVLMMSNEPYRPYNRVQLSAFLAGDVERDQLDLDIPLEHQPNVSFENAKVDHIDSNNKCITDKLGRTFHYDKLVIATGSRAFLPNIDGRDLSGVFLFRNIKDAEHLYARIHSARHIIIVGGGLLGCEAAKALSRYNTQVTLVQQATRLMNKQLDDFGADLLQQKLASFGINIITNDGVRKVHGESRVTGVDTRTGQHIECDTVLFCAGISPNIDLARDAKIKVARGIVVNDQMQTSVHDIYAIGECAEHAGQTYGIVNPGFEQAAVAAAHITGSLPEYKGSISVSRLKVVGEQVCSMGEVADIQERMRQKESTYYDKKAGLYRKVITQKGRLVGAMAVGEWPEMNRVQALFLSGAKVHWWQHWIFKSSGKLWFTDEDADVSTWSEETLVCQCNALSRGVLTQAIEGGCQTLEALQQTTKAGTVCGSCKPLLQQLYLGESTQSEKEIAWLPVMVFSLLAVIAATIIASIPGLTVADSVQTQGWFEQIWNDGFYKQVTGFTLLGLSVIGLLMSLRKRIKSEKLGQFAYWRLLHIVLGALCALVLIFHTGFHTGENLNQLLIFNFLGVLLLGATAGFVVSWSHKLKPTRAMKLRKFWAWTHIVVTWPLPALLMTHILTVYYF